MRKFATIENGKVVSLTSTSGAVDESFEGVEVTSQDVVIGDLYDVDSGTFTRPAPTPPSRMTKLAFRRRFTLAEKAAAEVSAETNPTMRVLLKDQEAATYIDLSDPATIEALDYMVSEGVITEARRVEILTAPVAPNEQA